MTTRLEDLNQVTAKMVKGKSMRSRQSLSDHNAASVLETPVQQLRRSLGHVMMTDKSSGRTTWLPSRPLVTTNDQQYTCLIERFQIRHVASIKRSQGSSTGRSTKVHPGLSSFQPPTQAHAGASEYIPEEWPVDTNDQDENEYKSWIVWLRDALVTPISPMSHVGRVRSVILLLTVGVHVIFFPVNVAFLRDDESRIGWTLEQAFQVNMVIDCGVSFNTAFMDQQGQLITARSAIAWQYARGWLVPDLFSIIPMNWFLSKNIPPWVPIVADVVLHLPRFLHVMEITYHAWLPRLQTSGRSIFSESCYCRITRLLQILWFVFNTVLVAHYIACMLNTLGTDVSAVDTTLALSQYVANLYDAFQLVRGQGVTTTSTSQSAFASISVLVGSVVLAILFGNIAIFVSNFSAHSTKYQRKMESVVATASKLKLPVPLEERIHQYYEHLWQEYESLDGEIVAFTRDLSQTLGLEVMTLKNMDLIMQVPFWRDASPDFLKQLVLRLHVRMYMPNDYIIRRGEVGDEFYMISRGVCELELGPDSYEGVFLSTENSHIDADEGHQSHPTGFYADTTSSVMQKCDELTDSSSRQTSHILRNGQSFGELSLIMNYERTGTARAITYSELCVLHRVALQEVFSTHPTDRNEVIKNILTRTLEHNESKKILCPLRQFVAGVFGSDVDGQATKSPAVVASLFASEIDAHGEDTSIKYGVRPSLRNNLSAAKANHDFDDDTSERETRSNSIVNNLDCSATKELESTLRDIVTRLDQVYISQLQLLSSTETLYAELLAVGGAFLEADCDHSGE